MQFINRVISIIGYAVLSLIWLICGLMDAEFGYAAYRCFVEPYTEQELRAGVLWEPEDADVYIPAFLYTALL